MLSGVLGVKESNSDDILSIPFHLSHYFEQEAQMDRYCSLKILNFHKNKMTLECYRYQEKKEEIWLSPMTKAPTPTEMSKGQSDNTNNATKKFD